MKNKLLSICTISAVGLLTASFTWAASPFPMPPKGGLPQCQANLTACQDSLASGILVVDAAFTRRPPGSTSGSGDTIEANCAMDPSGNAWQGATASLKIRQDGTASLVTIDVRDAIPNTVYDVWLRMRGNGPDGSQIGGSPMTGGAATALAPGSALDDLLAVSPPLAGTANPVNGFTTDGNGNADWVIDLDFPVVGGAYPFQNASDGAVQNLIDAGSTWPLVRIPSPVVNPVDPNISAPFLLRIVSHCTDGLTHGLSPATREAWFQYP